VSCCEEAISYQFRLAYQPMGQSKTRQTGSEVISHRFDPRPPFQWSAAPFRRAGIGDVTTHLVRNPGMVLGETIYGARRFHHIVFQRCVRCLPILSESLEKLFVDVRHRLHWRRGAPWSARRSYSTGDSDSTRKRSAPRPSKCSTGTMPFVSCVLADATSIPNGMPREACRTPAFRNIAYAAGLRT
jgi:hypothetical protein